MVAICPNTNAVQIYKKTGATFEKVADLVEHDQVVTGIDWGHKENRIVTCSQDRNAYVWKLDEKGNWKPTLVILRINRAATQVKWSPKEDKFAVASGSKVVSVCYFESDNDWWVAKHIKKHKSTVLSIDWHPNNVLLATGCSDFKVRIFSAFVKNVDQKGIQTAFGEKLPFGELFKEYDNGQGWCHGVAWSPSGDRLAFITHDSCISFANDVTKDVVKTTLPNLPFRAINFLDENTVVAAGHDCCPFIFAFEGGKWVARGSVDKGGDSGSARGTQSSGQAAMAMFKNQAAMGTAANETALPWKHQNCISGVVVKSAKSFSTSGVDGRIVEWAV